MTSSFRASIPALLLCFFGSQAVTAAEPDVTVSAVKLATAYAADEKAADEIYTFKVLRVDGVVTASGTDEEGVLFVDFKGVKGLKVRCAFPAAAAERVKKVKPGNKLTIQGENSIGRTGDFVGIDSCVFVE